MELNEIQGIGQYHIRAYEKNYIQVNENKLNHSFVISPSRLISPWPVDNVDGLTANDLQCILTLQPDILLLGSGTELTFPSAQILQTISAASIGVEVMDNGAACRTYSILMSEGRNVACALILGFMDSVAK